MALATDTSACAAIVDAKIFVESISLTASAYSFIPLANGTSFLPKFERSFFPVNNCFNPPVSCNAFDKVTNALAATEDLRIAVASTSCIASEYSFNPFANGTSFSPNFPKSCFPVSNCFKPPDSDKEFCRLDNA